VGATDLSVEATSAPTAPRARLRRSDGAVALILGLLLVAGAALRLSVAGQSMLGDELATYWIVSTNDFGGVISTVESDAEISPPLSFLLSRLAVQIDLTPEMLRLPSLLAGLATIPLVYLLGLRTVGRGPALLAAAFTTLSPFMIYYSAEARGYALMMALVTTSTLSMLLAVDQRRARWWVAYAVATAAAVYTHYTCVFLLAVQFLWLLWTHPEARRPALISTAAAAAGFLPWVPGALADFDSPTTDILAALQPLTGFYVRQALEQWALGHPDLHVPLTAVPGTIALVLLALALVLTVGGLVATRAVALRGGLLRADRRTLLMVLLALSVPAGVVLFSAVGPTSMVGARNLAASWPALGLALATVVLACGPRLRLAAAGLAVAAFGIAGANMLDSEHGRPQYEEASKFILDRSEPGDVVIDEVVPLSPGPLSPIDPSLNGRRTIYRSRAPQQRDHPFNLFDRGVPAEEASRKAALTAATAGGRIFLVTHTANPPARRPMGRYRLVERREYRGIYRVLVRIYEGPGPAASR
jgi:Dolichyl-phosphate-mannose-protein mannosyltransferase